MLNVILNISLIVVQNLPDCKLQLVAALCRGQNSRIHTHHSRPYGWWCSYNVGGFWKMHAKKQATVLQYRLLNLLVCLSSTEIPVLYLW